ncbi:calcineurin-like phosphoesterase family protein [Marinilabiliaceae bacterium ANBcel2]|nr:calcineurin-like phosphoesterase family protein [Marinilabiliaceae bacterium ANBcel2]
MKTFILTLSVLFALFSDAYGESRINGSVSSRGEKISGVVVTDGFHFTQTCSEGYFTLDLHSDAQFVYLSTPSNYKAPIENGVVQFYKSVDSSNFDFELKPVGEDSRHNFLVLADVQVLREEEFPMLDNAVDDMKEHLNTFTGELPVHVIDAGDLVFDRMDFFSDYINSLKPLDIPVYRVVGNHDIDFNERANQGSTKSYNKHFGPHYYSFSKGDIHYVVLNNTFYLGRAFYYIAYLTEEQLCWLEKDLSYVEEGSTVVLSVHIPTTRPEDDFRTLDYQRISSSQINNSVLYDILDPYNTHIISGHRHTSSRHFISDNIIEHNVAAVSGSWWQTSICPDGTPAGYMVFEVDGDDLYYYYKSIGKDKDVQFRVYKPGEDTSQKDALVVNVWGWDKTWSVEWSEDGVEKGKMEQYSGLDPLAVEILSDSDNLIHNWTSPSKTDHLFRAFPANDASEIEVVVTDSFGNKFSKIINIE